MAQQIKLYGERHTNTNYLSRLLELNLQCALIEGVVPTPIRTVERLFHLSKLRDWYFKRTYAENLGWKHSAPLPHIAAESVVFLTLTKNPYSWLLSMYRRPYHQAYQTQRSLEEFLQLPWTTVGRENVASVVQNPIELWNIKNRSYLSLPENRTLHINTESTFVDAAGVIHQIAEKFGIAKMQTEFINFERSTKKRTDRDGEYYRDYYLNERWRSELSGEAIELINTSLDPTLVAHYGYTLL